MPQGQATERRIVRVFPRRTKATPDDSLAKIGFPNLLDLALELDEVHVSVAFTWDLPLAEKIAAAWASYYPVRIGGPAAITDAKSAGAFVPGMYLKRGYVITSRGCPNRCWFCGVWRREGQVVRELPITDGWNVLDDNLLACSEAHVRAVFAMLKRQTERVQFTGGLEAARLQPWHVALLADLHPKQVFFAYDTKDDLEPLQAAGRMLLAAGFTTTSHALRAYVLIGWPRDTFEAAEQRLRQTVAAGFMPMAMLYRNAKNETATDWRVFQRRWARPAIIAARAA
ncbi:MAG: hypothetical protein NT169_19920 [Chloroflexi bacterium]|nr:hypothetical protein [Chloroflexota bacterium]